jgi:hypothetical protein
VRVVPVHACGAGAACHARAPGSRPAWLSLLAWICRTSAAEACGGRAIARQHMPRRCGCSDFACALRLPSGSSAGCPFLCDSRSNQPVMLGRCSVGVHCLIWSHEHEHVQALRPLACSLVGNVTQVSGAPLPGTRVTQHRREPLCCHRTCLTQRRSADGDDATSATARCQPANRHVARTHRRGAHVTAPPSTSARPGCGCAWRLAR